MAVRSVFWNSDERRVMAGWRLLIQFVGQFVVFITLYQLGLSLLGPLAGGEGATPEMKSLGLTFVFVYIVGTIVSLLSVWLLGRWLDRRRGS